MNTADDKSRENAMRGSHRRVALTCAAVAIGMVGMSYAAVPLYQMFCKVTGYGGTTQRAIAPSERVVEKSIVMRFDANTSRGLAWDFQPVDRTMDVKLGENRIAVYRATNTTDKPLRGTATFNVTPEVAGVYFNKIECFCFTEQLLKPGESVEMPVSFFVDPEIAKDNDASHITQITLSYTFYPMDDAPESAQRETEKARAARS